MVGRIMEYDRLKKRYFLELQEQLAKSERRHAEEIEQLSQQLSYQIQYNNTLLEHLHQLEQQQLAAQNVVVEAKKLLGKTAEERDNALDACKKLQSENQDFTSQVSTLSLELLSSKDEIKHLHYDNQLFRDELMKVKDDIAKYKDIMDKSNKDQSDHKDVGGHAVDSLQSQHMELIGEMEGLRLQLVQLAHSVDVERDRVQVLDLQLKKERSALASTISRLQSSEDQTSRLSAECSKLASNLTSKENEASSLCMDVDFLQNELKTAHKQAANYVLERDERSTMCDALSTHVTKLKDKIGSLETEAENLRKDSDADRESFEAHVLQLHDENARLVGDMHAEAQNHQADLLQKGKEMEEMKLNYEESMRDYCATLTQQCASIQTTLQDELRRILADKASVVQAAREDKVNLDAQIALLSSRLTTSETLAREMELRYKGEVETLKKERDWISNRFSSLQASSLECYAQFEEDIKESKELCVSLMSHYSALLSSVAPLPSVIQSMCNDQNSQTEVSIGQIQLLSQQYDTSLKQMELIADEKRMLGILLEEEKSKSLMLQDDNAAVQHALQAAQAQGAVAQELSLVVDSKTQEINSLNHKIQSLQDEVLQQQAHASSLLAKLDVAHCQLQIVNEENERALSSFAGSTMQHSHELASIEERLHATQAQLHATQTQLTTATQETTTTRGQLDESKATHAAKLERAAADAGHLEEQIKELAVQVQELRKFKAQAAEQQTQASEAKQLATQAQTAVLALQEQRKQLQSENIELKEELEHLYKHQQLLTTLQQQNHVSSHQSEPKLDVSIMEALKKQNRLIEDKCRMLQDNSMKMMKDFAIQGISPLPQSPDISGL